MRYVIHAIPLIRFSCQIMTKILFVGDLNTYGRSYQRSRTLKEMGHELTNLSHTKVSLPGVIDPPSLAYRISHKLRLPIDVTKVNKKINNIINSKNFDVLWIEKGNMIHPWTLWQIKRKFPLLRIVSCSEDDMYASHGHSLWYRYGLPFYDCVFTTKLYNLEELKTLGARHTKLFLDSYDEKIHKPIKLNEFELERFSCDVSAIGAFETNRANSLLYLAQHGIKVHVWGNGWSKMVNVSPNLIIKNEFLFGEDYSKAICATKININFLRKINRDEITSRSIEIPACGGFMLAERTSRHLNFFKESVEAEFFDSNEELLEKVKYYLLNAKERQRIANEGSSRCLASPYSMRAQLSEILIVAGESEKIDIK